MSSFSSAFFAGNRRRLRAQVKSDLIIVTANGLLQKIADEAFPFRQDSNFWYLTGIDEPDVILVMDKAKEYLLLPSRNAVREAFDGAFTMDEAAALSGIKDVRELEAGWKSLARSLKQATQFATLYPAPKYIPHYDMYANPARAVLMDKIREINSTIDVEDIRPIMAGLRTAKQPEEIAAITHAIQITADTLLEISKPENLAQFSYEYEIEAAISYGFRRRGAKGHAFEPVVASGARACTLHNMKADTSIEGEGLLLMDVGAQAEHYAADLTRTVSLGMTTRRQEQIHAAVLEAQEYAFSVLKPGVKMRDYEKKVEKFIGDKLIELGVLKTNASADVRRYFPHATSHFLGLDAHDAGDYEAPLVENAVLAVEPGIYIPEEGIGVRIEDNIVITKAGCSVLSSSLKRSL